MCVLVRPLVLALALATALRATAAFPAVPAVRIGEADVRESNGGTPCFTIAEREERLNGAPNFQAITVADASRKPRAVVWSMAMPAARTFPLMFSMCIPYAGRVAALPQENAELLEAGKLYEVTIEVRPGDAPGQPRQYAARFCLARQADGRHTVRLLAVAARAAGACGGEPPVNRARGKR